MYKSQLSYDTIHLYADRASIAEERLESAINILENLTEYRNVHQGDYCYSGHIDNLRISLSSDRIYIRGSIAKYVNGQNLEMVTISKVDFFIETITSVFEIEPFEWKISRLDMGVNLTMDYHIQSYQTLIAGAKYKTFSNVSGSIYLKSQDKVILIYDKIQEVKKDPLVSISGYDASKNIMRIEFQIKRQLKKHLQIPFTATLDKLTDSTFLKKCNEYCTKEFESVRLLFSKTDITGIRSMRDFESFLISRGVESIGLKEVETLGKMLRKTNIFKHKSYYNILMHRIRKRIEDFSLGKQNPLIEELINKMEKFNKITNHEE